MPTPKERATPTDIRLHAEQLAEVELALREIREGKIATDEEMEEVWRRFGR